MYTNDNQMPVNVNKLMFLLWPCDPRGHCQHMTINHHLLHLPLLLSSIGQIRLDLFGYWNNQTKNQKSISKSRNNEKLNHIRKCNLKEDQNLK